MPQLPLAFGVAFLVAGLLLFGLAWYEYARRRAIADTPTSKAESMAVGPVELKGVAQTLPGLAPFTGPFSEASCVYYRYRVEERRTRVVSTGKTSHTEQYWATVAQGKGAPEAIAVRDESGAAIVALAGAELPYDGSTGFGSGFLHDPPPHAREFLARQDVSTEGWFGMNKTMRYVEDRLTPGCALYVLGTAAIRAPPAGIDATSPGLNVALVVQKEGRVPFILSTGSEQQLVRGYGAKFVASLVAGVAMAVFGAAVLAGLV